jgi:two-component system, OmpR family, response regulator MprA
MKSPLSGGLEEATVLLVGPEAHQLAARLKLSGYRPLAEADLAESGVLEAPAARIPEAVILSPGSESRMAELRSRFGAVPLLLGIADDSVEGRTRCLASGADDFWLPGIGPSDLLMRLRLHLALGSVKAPASEVLQVADLLVRPQKRQVRRGPRIVVLTSREYQLLLLLLRHGGRVVSRERILQEIWADQGGGSSNVIEVYVRYLRQKLEAGGERRLLHTVRGQGYCLSERMPPREGQT